MPVCHCVGLHQKWAASADATTVTPTLVGREKARGSPSHWASASRRSTAGPLTEQEPQFTLRQFAPSVAACGSSPVGEPCREATVRPGALALSLALAISELIVLHRPLHQLLKGLRPRMGQRASSKPLALGPLLGFLGGT